MREIEEVRKLLDHALIERLTHSVRSDRQWTVRLLVELGEVQERGLYRELGFSSMFAFATRKLRMSEAEAGLRIRAAKLGRSFPIALEMLARSEVNLTTLSLLAPVLTHESLDLLHAARFKSKQEVLELLARHAPKPDVPDSVRKLPPKRQSARAPLRPNARVPQPSAAAPAGAPSKESSGAAVTPAHPVGALAATTTSAHPVLARPSTADSVAGAGSSTGSVAGSGSSAGAGSVEPLSAERYKISFTAHRRVRDLVRHAQELRRHRCPNGDLESLFEWALELAIAVEKKRRFGQPANHASASTVLSAPAVTGTPPESAASVLVEPEPPEPLPAQRNRAAKRQGPSAERLEGNHAPSAPTKPRDQAAKTSPRSHSRYIPKSVRRQVWQQHEGQCCFVAADGQRCEARSWLEFHHVVAFARGGPSSDADNIVLMCRAHNALEAERDFGRTFMQRRIEQCVSRQKDRESRDAQATRGSPVR
jgi:hypothetical protein